MVVYDVGIVYISEVSILLRCTMCPLIVHKPVLHMPVERMIIPCIKESGMWGRGWEELGREYDQNVSYEILKKLIHFLKQRNNSSVCLCACVGVCSHV